MFALINVFLCEDEEMQLEYFRYQISQYIEENQKDARLVSARRDPEGIISQDVNRKILCKKNPGMKDCA